MSYVIVNPSPKRKLRNGDIMYVVQPSSMLAVPNKNKVARTSSKPNQPCSQCSGQAGRPLSRAPSSDSDLVQSAGLRVSWKLGPNESMRRVVTTQEGVKAQADRKRSKSESSVSEDMNGLEKREIEFEREEEEEGEGKKAEEKYRVEVSDKSC